MASELCPEGARLWSDAVSIPDSDANYQVYLRHITYCGQCKALLNYTADKVFNGGNNGNHKPVS